MRFLPLLTLVAAAQFAQAELVVPAFTAYSSPEDRGARISSKDGVTQWTDPKTTVSWFGEFKSGGKITAALRLKVPAGQTARFQLKSGKDSREMAVKGDGSSRMVPAGEVTIPAAG